jgi:hypothetical protein
MIDLGAGGDPGTPVHYQRKIGDLFDLVQCAACVFVTVREGRPAGFGGPASGVWPPRGCPARLRRRPDVVAACCPALTMFLADDGVMGYFLSGREAHG